MKEHVYRKYMSHSGQQYCRVQACGWREVGRGVKVWGGRLGHYGVPEKAGSSSEHNAVGSQGDNGSGEASGM